MICYQCYRKVGQRYQFISLHWRPHQRLQMYGSVGVCWMPFDWGLSSPTKRRHRLELVLFFRLGNRPQQWASVPRARRPQAIRQELIPSYTTHGYNKRLPGECRHHTSGPQRPIYTRTPPTLTSHRPVLRILRHNIYIDLRQPQEITITALYRTDRVYLP